MNPCSPINFEMFARFLLDHKYVDDSSALAGILTAVAQIHWQAPLEYIEGDLVELLPSDAVAALVDRHMAKAPSDDDHGRAATSSAIVAVFQQLQASVPIEAVAVSA